MWILETLCCSTGEAFGEAFITVCKYDVIVSAFEGTGRVIFPAVAQHQPTRSKIQLMQVDNGMKMMGTTRT